MLLKEKDQDQAAHMPGCQHYFIVLYFHSMFGNAGSPLHETSKMHLPEQLQLPPGT